MRTMFIKFWMKIRFELIIKKFIFYLSIIFLMITSFLFLTKVFYYQLNLNYDTNINFIQYLDYFVWGIMAIDFLIITQILKKEGLQSYKFFFYLLIFFFLENFIVMAENLINQTNKIVLTYNWNISFWLLFIGFLILGLNPANGGSIKKIYQFMRVPRSFIAIGLGFLISTTVVLIEKYDKLAEQLAIFAYYFLALGVIYQIIVLRSKNKTEKSSSSQYEK